MDSKLLSPMWLQSKEDSWNEDLQKLNIAFKELRRANDDIACRALRDIRERVEELAMDMKREYRGNKI
jgi:hypothetical protein